ncbi:hypothetical protein L7F22_054187 [Adiantum nelumboides]|nr:hypothetical protein [Adiantum nelumboides]
MPAASSSGSPALDQQGSERSKAAAWAWYERGGAAGGSLCARQAGSSSSSTTVLMVRGKYMQRSRAGTITSHVEHHESSSRLQAVEPIKTHSKRRLLPSRFKQEAEGLASRRRCGAYASADDPYADEDVAAACSNPEISHDTSSSSSLWGLDATTCLPLTSSTHSSPPFTYRGVAPTDDYLPRRNCWLDSLFGISSRKSISSSYVDNELASLISLLEKDASSHRSSLFDSFELQAMLRKLGPYESAHHTESQQVPDQILEEKEALVSEVKEAVDQSALKKAHIAHDDLIQSAHNIVPVMKDSPDHLQKQFLESPPRQSCSMAEENILSEELTSLESEPSGDASRAKASRNKQTLHDLLQWPAPNCPKQTLQCNCVSESACENDDYYYSESPDINNISSCNNISCDTAKTAHRRRRRRRPSLLMPRLAHSFSSALHQFPHLPHSFSHALHHLPQSLSNALHHFPNLPHSLSNAFHQIAHFTHSLSSVYKHQHGTHSVEASPCHDAAHVHAHKQSHFPSPLHHLFSFKTHHSPTHSANVGTGGVSPTADCHMSSASPPRTAMLVRNRSKSPLPFREQRLSASNDYMLIYSSNKKYSSSGIVHHHHHHHYHHHYIFSGQENL